MQLVLIQNQTHPTDQPLQVRYCASFLGRLRGLMFQKSLGTHQGLVMVQPRADRLDAAIHMLFMNFDIAVIWADEELRVVDAQHALRWRPVYAPTQAAKYVLEIHPDRLNDFEVGDQLVITQC
jgi:uncharacterized membrane protein (UPF0127 family)